MTEKELRASIEAILFISTGSVSEQSLIEAFPEEGREAILAQIEEIRLELENQHGGFQLEQAAGGFRLATRPEHDSMLRKFFSKQGENRLSLAALETLAIVAYRQPVTSPEVSEIRGVNSSGVIRTLLERKMIRIAGRKNVVGSPFLYRTTREFLTHFGLNAVQDLPRLEEFADLVGENLTDAMGEGDSLVDLAAAAEAVVGTEKPALSSEGELEASPHEIPGLREEDARDVSETTSESREEGEEVFRHDVSGSSAEEAEGSAHEVAESPGEGEEVSSHDVPLVESENEIGESSAETGDGPSDAGVEFVAGDGE